MRARMPESPRWLLEHGKGAAALKSFLKLGIGLGWVMLIFAGLCVVGVVFVYRSLPETKGKSVEDVIKLFERPVNLKDPSQLSVKSA